MTTGTGRSTGGRNTSGATGRRQAVKPDVGAASALGDVGKAVARDLARMPADLAGSGWAASAMALAAEIDAPNSATSKSMCARALLDTLNRLRELCPAREESDTLDDLASRRAARLTGS